MRYVKTANVNIPYTAVITFSNGMKENTSGYYSGAVVSKLYEEIHRQEHIPSCIA